MGDTLKKIQYTVNESEDSDNDWVSVDIVLADGRAFQVWIDEGGISIAIGPEKEDGYWEPTGISPCWDDLKAQPILEEKEG